MAGGRPACGAQLGLGAGHTFVTCMARLTSLSLGLSPSHFLFRPYLGRASWEKMTDIVGVVTAQLLFLFTARKRNTALPTPIGGTPAQPPGHSPLCVLSPPLKLSQQCASPFPASCPSRLPAMCRQPPKTLADWIRLVLSSLVSWRKAQRPRVPASSVAHPLMAE